MPTRSPRRRLPSPAMVVALVALCVAMAGTGYAAKSVLDTAPPHTVPKGDAASTQIADAAQKKKARRGRPGPPGPQGATGPPGAPGTPGQAAPIQYAEFYALMPPDNASTVAVGGTVDLPRNGPRTAGIEPIAVDAWRLHNAGTYRVAFSVSVSEAGQLQLTLNGTPVPESTFGRATGTSQISGETLITTATPDSQISLINPTGNSTALTITPLAGGTQAVAASLVIEQVG